MAMTETAVMTEVEVTRTDDGEGERRHESRETETQSRHSGLARSSHSQKHTGLRGE